MFMSLAILPNPTGCHKYTNAYNHANIKHDNKIPKTCNTKIELQNAKIQGRQSNYNIGKNSFKFNRNFLSMNSIESQTFIRKISTFYEKCKYMGTKGTRELEKTPVKFLYRPLLYKISKSPTTEEFKI